MTEYALVMAMLLTLIFVVNVSAQDKTLGPLFADMINYLGLYGDSYDFVLSLPLP